MSYFLKKIKFHGCRRSRQWSESLPKYNHFFHLPFWTYPDNFIKIHPEVFELSCSQTNKQTNRWTDKPRRKHNLLGGGNNDRTTIECRRTSVVACEPSMKRCNLGTMQWDSRWCNTNVYLSLWLSGWHGCPGTQRT